MAMGLIRNKKLVLTLIFGVVILMIDIVLLVTDPVLIVAKYYVRLEDGSYVHRALQKEFPGVYVSAYLFNVTNSDQFQSGEDHNLKVEEVGPFTYQEMRLNENVELDPAARVVRYTPRIRSEFRPELSVAHPDDLNVTMPNLAMLSMASKVGAYGFLPQMGFNLLANRLKSRAIVSMRASDYLWGYEEPLIKLGHDLIPGFVNFDVLGVLDRLYDKKAHYLLELSANDEDKFAIKKVNGVKGLDKWGYNIPEKRTMCNSFKNVYEGIGYRPEVPNTMPIRIYRPILCRILELDYKGTVMTPYGVEGLEYVIGNRTYQKNNETECLCSKGNCLEGVSDLSPCFLGLPVVLSHAHFLNADPKLYERIEGMKPDESRHGSSFVIEPRIGMVLNTSFTVQVSLMMRDVRFNAETSSFSDMLVPVVYVKVTQPLLIPEQHHNLNLLHFYGPWLLLAFQVFLAATSIGLLAYSVRLLYWNRWTAEKHIILCSDVSKPLMS